jgi:hypothetical protein
MNKNCFEISQRIIEMSGVNIFDNTRKREYVQLRALACHIFRDKMKMRWRTISEFFEKNGKLLDHSSAIHLVNNYPIYAKACPELKEIESCFVFDDNENYDEIDRVNYLKNKVEKLNTTIFKLKGQVKELKKRPVYNSDDVEMLNLFTDVPADKVDELLERITLLKKSWTWKSKDRCQVIESF